MRKIIGIAGVPGTGKSTLMNAFMKQYVWEAVSPAPLLSAHYCQDLDLYVLGKYEAGETFPGTDKLSMSCQPNVEQFVSETKSNILFEGDRLTNSKFFNFLIDLADADVLFFILKAGNLAERYEERGSNQSEQFLKGRETKIKNIEANMDYWDYTWTFSNSTLEDQAKILAALDKEVNHGF